MKVTRVPAITLVSALLALASCTGDETQSAKPSPARNPSAQSTTQAGTPAVPASPASPENASSSGRQPIAPLTAQNAQTASSNPADEGAAEDEAPLLSPSEAAILTQEQADLDAAQSINEENADAELEKLEQELGGEIGGG